jgi:imidazolonepropionase-like amidohydrolase
VPIAAMDADGSEATMGKLGRRIRGAIGMGFTWAVAWSAVGAVVPRLVLGYRPDAPFPIIFGVLGFCAGVIFSVVLALTEGRRRFDQMSLPRFAGWGAAGGLLLSALFSRAASLGWGDMLLIAPTFALASAACASGSLALARRATRGELADRRSSFAVPLLLLVAARGIDAQQPIAPADSGTFTLYKFQQAIGQERYRITRRADRLVLTDSFSFTDRGSRVPLETTLETTPAGDPLAFRIKGRVSRQSSIDAAVTLRDDSVTVRVDSGSRIIVRPASAFTIGGYAPVALQEALIGYWQRHGRPATLATLPSGHVMIERRGTDTLSIGGASVALERFGIAGLIWGRETLWLDAGGRLAALVSIDAEFDHFEAIRSGYESGLATFVARAAVDAGAALAELARKTQPSGGDRFALVGATLIDGDGGPSVPDATVVVDGGRIVAAGARARVPAGFARIDARGSSVLPGLWDMHAHYEQVEWGPIYLAAGVTTVRDVGNELEFIESVRDANRNGKGIGPRLLLAGIVDGSGPFAVGVNRVDTPEQAVAEVNRYHDAGFQQMKIYSSMTPEMVRAVAAEAHRLGMTVTGHVPRGMNARDAVEAGMDQINHISNIRPIMVAPPPASAGAGAASPALDLSGPEATAALKFLAEHHTVVDPTLALYELVLHPIDRPAAAFEPGIVKLAPELRSALQHLGTSATDSARAQAQLREFLAITGALHRAGITIVAGTDQTVPGHSLHRELELYVQAGFTPMEAIQAATVVPARVMHLDAEVGTIAVGKRADLLVVDGNPLQSFSDLRRVRLVVAGGRRYEPAALWRSVGFEP